MEVIVRGEGIQGGIVSAPPSKSLSHRAIINASLGNGESWIKSPLLSKDIYSTMRGVEAFGADSKKIEEDLLVKGFNGKPKTPDDIVDLGNSGTSLRFLLSIAGLLSEGTAVFSGDESLRSRPNYELINALNELGADVFSTNEDGTAPLVVSGVLEGGEVEIKGDVSSQFVSSLITALSLCKRDSEIKIRGKQKSKPYIDMTIDLLNNSGIEIKNTSEGYFIPRSQSFKPIDYRVSGDYSSASNFLVLGALSNNVKVNNLNKKTQQGDYKILEVLKKVNAGVRETKEGFSASPNELNGFELDLSNNPDLFPILAVLGSYIEEEVVLKNIEHVRYKECDRVGVMQEELNKMDIETRVQDNDFYVGESSPSGAVLDGHNDHRIVMALTVASLLTGEKSKISDAESVKISYPNFFEDIRELGGKIRFQGNK